ncbi:CHAT domain-containing protein [Coleofasciculus sp. FACHB-SPT9]|nr:CHAT domain-containing protein [Coleofasciculus sp. FACHB-SPT9]MBD1887771.1 CHAT domain-containing protein [Coleofasciculus sp. FACHB-SPT9]
MLKIRWLIKSIHYRILLSLLTLFLVTAFLPALAQTNLKFSYFDSQLVSIVKNIPDSDAPSESKQNDAFVLEQGRTLYEAGRFDEAIAFWQQALENLEAQGNRLHAALVLSYLSNAYQELGQWEQAKNAIAQSLNLLQTQPDAATLAQVLNTQGSLQLALGQTEAALDTWKQAEKAYGSAGDDVGKLGSLINQAQALQALGLYRQAKTNLEQLNTQLQNLPDSSLKVSGLRSLGVTLQVVGDLTQSQQVLEQSLSLAQRLNFPLEINASLFSLGNTLRALQKPREALEIYRKIVESSPNSLVLEVQLNRLSLLVETGQPAAAQALLPQIQSQLESILPSRAAVYSRVNLARTLIKLGNREERSQMVNSQEIAQILAKAVEQARMLKDSRAESYALGQLGYLYEQMQQWKPAEDLTRQALAIAQEINAFSIVARWEGQLGKLLKQQGDIPNAIAAYTKAVKTLQSLRSDLIALNPDVQLSFRENVEPIYRELVELLLEPNPSQTNIKQAREVMEALHLAELDNFFREACLDVQPQQIDQLDPQAAVIYPIILSNRLEVILSLPRKSLSHYSTRLVKNDIEETLEQLLESLNPFFSTEARLRLSQQVYRWLIQPVETELTKSNIATLVFVLDGSLRSLPMAALYDGKQYLIEKYNIVVAPGLQLVAPRVGSASLSQLLAQKRNKILAGGITEARQGFPALPGVGAEVSQIASEVPSKVFINEDFTEVNLQNYLNKNSFTVVHLATHGQFSSSSDSTFILTWNGRINVKEFENLLRSRDPGTFNPIELLVLSACQTATGDKRAVLGLAGVAVRSGARSTLATLWSVQDESTAKLMGEFYQQLLQGESKVKALRQAQIALLKQPKYAHPFYWSSFILVGSWL